MGASNRGSGFWTGGYEAYCKALVAECRAAVKDLRRQLDEAETLLERERLEEAIRRTEKTYRAKLDRAGEHLY